MKNIITKEARAPIREPKNESHTVLSPTIGVKAGIKRTTFKIIGMAMNAIIIHHQYFFRISIFLRDFAGFDFGFEELEDIDGSLIVEAAFGVVELCEGG